MLKIQKKVEENNNSEDFFNNLSNNPQSFLNLPEKQESPKQIRSEIMNKNPSEINNQPISPQKNLSVPHHVEKIKEKETFKTINPSNVTNKRSYID